MSFTLTPDQNCRNRVRPVSILFTGLFTGRHKSGNLIFRDHDSDNPAHCRSGPSPRLVPGRHVHPGQNSPDYRDHPRAHFSPVRSEYGFRRLRRFSRAQVNETLR